MQPSTEQVIIFLITTSGIVFLLAMLTIGLIYLYQKRKQFYVSNLSSIKLDYDRSLLKTQVEIQEQTFENISREIHDHINLSLTLAKLNLTTIDWHDPGNVREVVKNSISIIGSSITDLSDISKSLSPEIIKNMGLIKAVGNEVERINHLTRLDIELAIGGEPVFMECEKELVIFRIIQEAFNNIIKHAQASRVWLTLEYGEVMIEVLIKDNGIGFDKEQEVAQKKKNAGLNNIRTRAKLFNGKLKIESHPNLGTCLIITIPYN